MWIFVRKPICNVLIVNFQLSYFDFQLVSCKGQMRYPYIYRCGLLVLGENASRFVRISLYNAFFSG